MKHQIIVDNNLFRKLTHSSSSVKLNNFIDSLSNIEGITTAAFEMPAPGVFEFLGFNYPNIQVNDFESYKRKLILKAENGEDFSGILAKLHQELEALLLASPEYTCNVAIEKFKNQFRRMNSNARDEFETFLKSRLLKKNRLYILKDIATEMMLGLNWGSNQINEKVILSFIANHFNAVEKQIEFSSRYFFKIWKYLKLKLNYKDFNLYATEDVFKKLLVEIERIIHISDSRDYFDSKALLWLIEGYGDEKKKIVFATCDPFNSVFYRISLVKLIHFSTYCWVYSTDKYKESAKTYGTVMVYGHEADLKQIIDVDKVPSLYHLLKQGLLSEAIIADAHNEFDI